ncbi:MAG: hypothetical protein WC768_04580 [Patescibacteria group bacterium]|jgi:GH24 family phage-related lysozyme (muramidase)
MKYFRIIIFSFFLVFLLLPVGLKADSNTVTIPNSSGAVSEPKIQFQLGNTPIKFGPIEPCGGNYCIPWIGDYISALYKYGIGLAATLAIVMIMAGGLVWLMSAGSPDKVGTAKEFIASALSGLLLAFFAFMILATINPSLINLQGIKIKQIQVAKLPGVTGPIFTPGYTGIGDYDYYPNPGQYNLPGGYAGDAYSYILNNEGSGNFSLGAYQDNLGNWTIGAGCRFTPGDQVTLTYANGTSETVTLNANTVLSPQQAEALYQSRLVAANQTAINYVGGQANWDALGRISEARQVVLTDMAFNLGQAGLNGFTQLQTDILAGIGGSQAAWVAVGNDIITSRYAGQVGDRAIRNAHAMISGSFDFLLNH